MTREETYKRFKRWAQSSIGNHGSDEDYNMAENIMALLSQEPCEDAISRKYIQEKYYTCADMLHPDADIVMAWVDEAPPVRLAEKKNVEIVKFDTPYTDAISRQAAIDAMREETCLSCWDAKYILEHLPPVSTEKTGRWIPVSERLPEKNGRYLVTSPLGDRFVVRIGYFVDNERCFACENATAWLPLPQPYKEESEE